MIIFGTNSKNLKQAPLESYECPNCKTKNSVLAIIADYFHLFWIPVFPYKKTTHIVCTECEFSQTETKLAPELKDKIKQLKTSVPLPKYMFLGSVLLIAAAGLLYYFSLQSAKREQEYLVNPQIGDVYILKDMEEQSMYNHYLLKVVDLSDDSLYVTFNSYSYNGVINKLDPEDGFYDVFYAMHKSELEDYDTSGELRKIIRDYRSYAGFDNVLEYTFSERSIEQELKEEN